VAYDPDRVVMQLGKRIAELRAASGLSQGTLAEKVRSTPQWISQLERGTRSPTLHTLCKLANALDVTLPDLFATTAVATTASKTGARPSRGGSRRKGP
jgi:transcriptional regulator with XRE-family HTH domain